MFGVSACSGYGQLDLSTGTDLAPDLEIASNKFGAFAHASQAPMPGGVTLVKNGGIDALAVVADSEPQVLLTIPHLHFQSPSPCMSDRVS